jgi:hypothetical protein
VVGQPKVDYLGYSFEEFGVGIECGTRVFLDDECLHPVLGIVGGGYEKEVSTLWRKRTPLGDCLEK